MMSERAGSRRFGPAAPPCSVRVIPGSGHSTLSLAEKKLLTEFTQFRFERGVICALACRYQGSPREGLRFSFPDPHQVLDARNNLGRITHNNAAGRYFSPQNRTCPNDRTLADCCPSKNQGAFPNINIVMNNYWRYAIDPETKALMKHLNCSIMAYECGVPDTSTISDPRVLRINEASRGQDRAIFAQVIDPALLLQESGPFSAVRTTEAAVKAGHSWVARCERSQDLAEHGR